MLEPCLEPSVRERIWRLWRRTFISSESQLVSRLYTTFVSDTVWRSAVDKVKCFADKLLFMGSCLPYLWPWTKAQAEVVYGVRYIGLYINYLLWCILSRHSTATATPFHSPCGFPSLSTLGNHGTFHNCNVAFIQKSLRKELGSSGIKQINILWLLNVWKTYYSGFV